MAIFFRRFSLFFLFIVLSSCATSDKDFKKEVLVTNEEFERVVKIQKIEPLKEEKPVKEQKKQKTSNIVSPKKVKIIPKKKKVKKVVKKQSAQKEKTKKRLQKQTKLEKKKPIQDKKKRMPPLEDDEGFDGRRPLVEPFKVGEELVMGISYFAVEAGKFTMQVRPMVEVNGKKSYHFRYLIKTSPLFAMFYSVNDVAETFVDYETLLPYSYEIHVDESKQARETKTYFDHPNKKAIMWDKKKKKGQPLEEKKIKWDLLEYSQNVFSAAFYLRTFTLKVGKKLKVRVGHEGKNIIMTAEVLRKEKLYTDVGAFDTYVIKPSFDIDGKFKPTGENLLWLTADDRKFIVRLESKIKIGTIVGKVQKLKK